MKGIHFKEFYENDDFFGGDIEFSEDFAFTINGGQPEWHDVDLVKDGDEIKIVSGEVVGGFFDGKKVSSIAKKYLDSRINVTKTVSVPRDREAEFDLMIKGWLKNE